ncbi:MAG TPA: hypothetical protein DD643_04155, partial [Synechococcus sp. UBA8638]|nr:hypothetical protein [Synechococcus sp. UBA8638]
MLWLGCAAVLAGLVLGGLEQFFWSLPVAVGLLLLTTRLGSGQSWGVRCLPCLLVVAFAGYGQWRGGGGGGGGGFFFPGFSGPLLPPPPPPPQNFFPAGGRGRG